MSNMKKTFGLLAAQMALYAASGEDLYGVPSHIVRVQKKPSKGEAKKCKSCKFFPCYESKEPMRIACEKHERRKKK